MIATPFGVCATSGWNCTENSPRSGSSMDATSIRSVRRGHAEPVRRARHAVPVAHPDLLARLELLQEDAGLEDLEARAAVLAIAGRRDLAAERLRHQLVPVADPEHGDAELEQAGSTDGAPSS